VKKQVWVIDGGFVMEPYLGGKLLCEITGDCEIPSDVEVISYSQKEFDEMVEVFYKENGYYPDS